MDNLITYEQYENARVTIGQMAINELTELQQKKDDEHFKKQISDITEIGDTLARAFDRSGDGFISKLNQALKVAVQIAEFMKKQDNGEETGILDYLKILQYIPGIFHSGGIVAHSGRLLPDEVPVLAKKGEMILNKDQQSNLFQMISSGASGGSRSTSVNIYLDGKQIGKKTVTTDRVNNVINMIADARL
jgi:hypothetical protein